MLDIQECIAIACLYVLEVFEIWENKEAYFIDDIQGKWGENYGVVVYKETGEAISLYEYFERKKSNDVLSLFTLYGLS